MLTTLLRTLLLGAVLVAAGCKDPPGDGFLQLDIDRQALRAGFSAVDFTVEHIAIFYDPVPPIVKDDDRCGFPGAGFLDSPPLPVHLDLTVTGRTTLATVAAKTGVVTEVRLLIDKIRIMRNGVSVTADAQIECDATSQEDRPELAVLRLIPPKGTPPIEIFAGQITTAAALFDPNRDLILENDEKDAEKGDPAHHAEKGDPVDHGEKGDADDDDEITLASTYDLKLIPPEESGGLFVPDQVIVRFKDGTSQKDIDDAVSARNASVLRVLLKRNYYTLKLPDGSDLKDALDFYQGRKEVLYALPNTFLSNLGFPNDYDSTRQPQWTIKGANIEGAWDQNPPVTGSYTVVVAVIDAGFDLANRDLVGNYFINKYEIPPKFFAKVPDRNFNGRPDVDDLDIDPQDGLITFSDLNSPLNAFVAADGGPACPLHNHHNIPLDFCDPLDLVNGGQHKANGDGSCPADDTKWGYQDGIDAPQSDGKPNGFCDDVVGWNFGNNNNLPSNDDLKKDAHGTAIAGIIGAIGNNAGDDNRLGKDTKQEYVGVNWQVRILPIQDSGGLLSKGGLAAARPFRDTVIHSIDYALSSGVEANVINISQGFWVSRDDNVCKDKTVAGKSNISDDNFKKFLDPTNMEFADTGLSDIAKSRPSLVVTAAGNCAFKLDQPFFKDRMPNPDLRSFFWPNSLNVDGLQVGSVNNNRNASDFNPTGAFAFSLFAPGEGFVALTPKDGELAPASNDGSSFSAAMASGVAALILSTGQNVGAYCDLANRIIRNTSQGILDGSKAVANVNGTQTTRVTLNCPF